MSPQKIFKIHVFLNVIASVLFVAPTFLLRLSGCISFAFCGLYKPSIIEQTLIFIASAMQFVFALVSVAAFILGISVMREGSYRKKIFAWVSVLYSVPLFLLGILYIVSWIQQVLFST